MKNIAKTAQLAFVLLVMNNFRGMICVVNRNLTLSTGVRDLEKKTSP